MRRGNNIYRRQKLLRGAGRDSAGPLYRVRVGNKERYSYLAIYYTPDIRHPDVCLWYGDTRTIPINKLIEGLNSGLSRLPSNGRIIWDKGDYCNRRFNKVVDEIKKVKLVRPIRGL